MSFDYHVSKKLVASCVNDPDAAVIKSHELGTVPNVEILAAGVIDDAVRARLQLD